MSTGTNITRYIEEAATVLSGDGNLLLICEHAGFAVPPRWGSLGLDDCYFATHFAGDIGAETLTRQLANALGLPAVLSTYSRMFLDYNRFEDHWEYCRPDLGGIPVPGNLGLTAADKAERARIAVEPVEQAIESLAENVEALISIHTFTPVFHGVHRGVEVGLVWQSGSEFGAMASSVFRKVGQSHGVRVEDNVPYAWTDTGARTLNVHGTARARKAVCIEVNNALLLDPESRDIQTAFLTEALDVVSKNLKGHA